MEALYKKLSGTSFLSNQEAILFCHESFSEYDIQIKAEATSDQNTICIYCEKTCPWTLLLLKGDKNHWYFQQSNVTHNHSILQKLPEWPQHVYDRIHQLSHVLQPDEIRDTIKQEFPDITWSDRRFYDCLMEDRITNRVQRILMTSTRLCSIVAGNEDWANNLENHLLRLLSSFNDGHPPVVDLDVDKIHSDSKTKDNEPRGKKRKAADPHTKVVHVPSCILYVPSQPTTTRSEPKPRRPAPRVVPPESSTMAMNSYYDFTFNPVMHRNNHLMMFQNSQLPKNMNYINFNHW